jgi:D-serine deaminase-like pyridoxal phosphate-dependent protein
MAPGTGFEHLCPHVKTHKSAAITKMQIEAGITAFKCTPNEVEMLARAGAKDIFVAYPLMLHDAKLVAECARIYPASRIAVQAGNAIHAEILKEAARTHSITFPFFIDVDVGMHRTGCTPESVLELHREICTWKEFEFQGLHGYDGHIHYPEIEKRISETKRSMGLLRDLISKLRKEGIGIPRIIVAGSITYINDFHLLSDAAGSESQLQISPGNWIYWDSGYDAIMPGAFEIAALVLVQAIEVAENRVTLNCGHKRWGADRGALQLFSLRNAEVLSYNEEHTVLRTGEERSCCVGDHILLAPRHACSTVNLYDYFVLVDEEGSIVEREVGIEGRNR